MTDDSAPRPAQAVDPLTAKADAPRFDLMAQGLVPATDAQGEIPTLYRQMETGALHVDRATLIPLLDTLRREEDARVLASRIQQATMPDATPAGLVAVDALLLLTTYARALDDNTDRMADLLAHGELTGFKRREATTDLAANMARLGGVLVGICAVAGVPIGDPVGGGLPTECIEEAQRLMDVFAPRELSAQASDYYNRVAQKLATYTKEQQA